MEKIKLGKPKDRVPPQIKVRLGLRGGESVDACLNNIEYWKKEYDKNYKKAQSLGRPM